MIRWKVLSKPHAKSPTLIEGLPGIGNVGKVAAEYLVEKLDAEKFAELYSDSFPYHVFVNDDDTIDLPKMEFYYTKNPELILITGDVQSMTPEGHYEITNAVVEFLKDYNVSRYITLGGFGVNAMPKEPKVIGAVTCVDLKEEYSKYGLEFENGERVGIIIGASGLLLGFSKLDDIDGVCLMGETLSRPMFTDAKSAKAVLHILCRIIGADLDMADIDARSDELDKAVTKAHEIEKRMVEKMAKPAEDLRYIG